MTQGPLRDTVEPNDSMVSEKKTLNCAQDPHPSSPSPPCSLLPSCSGSSLCPGRALHLHCGTSVPLSWQPHHPSLQVPRQPHAMASLGPRACTPQPPPAAGLPGLTELLAPRNPPHPSTSSQPARGWAFPGLSPEHTLHASKPMAGRRPLSFLMEICCQKLPK